VQELRRVGADRLRDERLPTGGGGQEDALAAAERPEAGDWLYFVTVDDDGTTLFTSDYQEHLANRDKALDSGILNSGR